MKAIPLLLLYLSLSALLAGCGESTGAIATHPVTSTPVASVSPRPIADGVQPDVPCRSSKLEFGIGDRVSEPTGQYTLSLTLTNRSMRSCTLFGYPTVSLFDAAGSSLPFVYQQHGDQVVTSQSPRSVDVSPGGIAYVTINKYRCDLGDKAMASSVQLLLPNDATPLKVALSPTMSVRSFGYCGPGDPGSIVSISPLASTFKDTIGYGAK